MWTDVDSALWNDWKSENPSYSALFKEKNVYKALIILS